MVKGPTASGVLWSCPSCPSLYRSHWTAFGVSLRPAVSSLRWVDGGASEYMKPSLWLGRYTEPCFAEPP